MRQAEPELWRVILRGILPSLFRIRFGLLVNIIPLRMKRIRIFELTELRQGIRMYARGEIAQPGSIVTVVFVVIVAAISLTQVAPQILAIAKSATAADELFQTIDRQSAIDPGSTYGLKPDSCIGDLEVRRIDFAYPSRPHTQCSTG
jgi:ABC-type multidrug transport system fused ATPase/permease subunit